LKNTGGLGVDFILDNFILPKAKKTTTNEQQQPQQATSIFQNITTLDLVNCLAPNGKWLTQYPNLQLDSVYSSILHFKSASLIFHSPLTWTSNNSQQGRYLTILNDLFERIGRQQLFVLPSLIESKTASNAQTLITQFLNEKESKAFVIKMS
jgi:hypothetical protein